MYHGIINVYKEAGYTSFDVVAKLRGVLKQKKIGHTGTLDPNAVGVLPVCLGSATRLCDMLTDKEKEYEAMLRLGIMTDTQDISGRILQEKPVTSKEAEVTAAILSFVGEYNQLPPMYSAIKINGKRLYESARAGKEIERPTRKVNIREIEILSLTLPEAAIRVKCSKGTYIRTLCHDIGAELGCGATMTHLIRTRSGDFTLDKAYTLQQLVALEEEARIPEVIHKIDEILSYLPAITIPESHYKLLRNGNPLSGNLINRHISTDEKIPDKNTDVKVRVYSHTGQFYGIYQYQKSKNFFYPFKMFFT